MPTTEQFKTRFPEFGVVPDALVSLVLDETSSVVGENWPTDRVDLATSLLAAHTLAMEGEPQRSTAIAQGQTATNAQSGPVNSVKIGDVAVSHAGRMTTGGGATASAANEYAKTSYGARYQELLRRTFPGVVTV